MLISLEINVIVFQLLDLLKREQKLLLACIDKATIESLRIRQNELFRCFITLQKIYKPTSSTVAIKDKSLP